MTQVDSNSGMIQDDVCGDSGNPQARTPAAAREPKQSTSPAARHARLGVGPESSSPVVELTAPGYSDIAASTQQVEKYTGGAAQLGHELLHSEVPIPSPEEPIAAGCSAVDGRALPQRNDGQVAFTTENDSEPIDHVECKKRSLEMLGRRDPVFDR